MDDLFKRGKFGITIPVRGETNNYEVKIVSEGFLDELHKQMAITKKFDVKTILKTLTGCFDREDVYMYCTCPDFCLEENTKIKLLNNEAKTIKELKEMFDNGKQLWVYSTDEDGDFQPGKVKDIWVSGYEQDMIKVVLNNREHIITTPNHRYRLKNGEYEEAQNLEVGQSLMSIQFRDEDDFDYKVKSIERLHYEEPIPVYDISIEKHNNFYVDAGVILHNCYRYQYWATKNKYNSGPAQPSNGKWIRNPNDSLGSGCKHTLLVLSNNSWILPCCRVIYNYVNWMEEHRQQMYAEQIYPAIYEKEYEDDVQLDLLATDELGDEDEIKAGNIHKGRDTRGRFTSEQEPGQFRKKQEPTNTPNEEEGEEEQ